MLRLLAIGVVIALGCGQSRPAPDAGGWGPVSCGSLTCTARQVCVLACPGKSADACVDVPESCVGLKEDNNCGRVACEKVCACCVTGGLMLEQQVSCQYQ